MVSPAVFVVMTVRWDKIYFLKGFLFYLIYFSDVWELMLIYSCIFANIWKDLMCDVCKYYLVAMKIRIFGRVGKYLELVLCIEWC